jgi:hypothetical protein
MMARFGVVLTDGAGKTAIRATYGGFLTGTGALIGSCALASERLVLQVVLILSSSILTARVIGMIADRSANAYHLTYACLEITAILVSGAGLISGAVTSAPG